MQSRHEETDTLGPPAYNCEWVGKRFARTHLVVEKHAALPLLAELARVAVAHAGVAEAVVLVLVVLSLVVVPAVRPRRGAAAAAGRVGRRPRRRRPPGVRGARQQRGEVVARAVHGRPADVGVFGALDDLRERERRERGVRERGEREERMSASS
jgi:hypothetical protein